MLLFQSEKIKPLTPAFLLASAIGLTYLLVAHIDQTHKGVIHQARNFYGSFQVAHLGYRPNERSLRHGNIIHGQQFLDEKRRSFPTSYYGEQSGVGHAIAFMHKQGPIRVGAIGLGTGTLAALGQAGDDFCFYEIDKDIVDTARRYFYFLADSNAKVEVIVNDGRLALAQSPPKVPYQVIAIDAFAGDSIPIHLLTKEAIEQYLAALTPDGILAFHISSRYLDLYPPLQAAASALDLKAYATHNSPDRAKGVNTSLWVLLTRNPSLGNYLYHQHALYFKDKRTDVVWTDDKSYLLSAIKW